MAGIARRLDLCALGRKAQAIGFRTDRRVVHELHWQAIFGFRACQSLARKENPGELSKGGFRYVVFGHTHQAKSIEFESGRWYFNSGTWADVLRFPFEILKLPETDAALVLLYLDELSYQEMAEVLGISESNVGVKLNRAKKALSELMKGRSHGP